MLLRNRLDYNALNLKPFLPGAAVHFNGQFHFVSDPFRVPFLALSGLFSPVGSIIDKLRVLALRTSVLSSRLEEIVQVDINSVKKPMKQPSKPLNQFLRENGFSDQFINAFFRPFYQGIFLAPLAKQSSQMFNFIFRMFSEASASLPSDGIGAITQQMRDRLPSNVDLKLNAKVTELSSDHVVVNTQTLTAPVVIIATEAPEAIKLLGDSISTAPSRGSICLYFTSNRPAPINKPILMLNGDGDKNGPINNVVFLSEVVKSYAPEGKTLISAVIVGDELGKSNDVLEREARKQLTGWFGEEELAAWSMLRIYRIPHSQTAQNPEYLFDRDVSLGDGLFVCGDHRNSPTLHGAILSGRIAADKALAFLREQSPTPA